MRSRVALILIGHCCCGLHADVTFEWATVGNPGNFADSTGFGSVSYVYNISKHEVTYSQYTEFLNKVAATDNFGGVDPFLYDKRMEISRSGGPGTFSYAVVPGFEQRPIDWVSFVDAMRFVNWLENGQGFGGTESGVYSIDQGWNEVRAAGATYFITSEDEWYKAAYHDPGAPAGYWKYPTKSNVVPSTVAPPGDANSGNMAGGGTTNVGAYASAESFHGTFDQAGNVTEFTEGVTAPDRIIRGGHWFSGGERSAETVSGIHNPTVGDDHTGFRVASIPEPSAFVFLAIAGIHFGGRAYWRRRRSQGAA